MYLVRPGGAAHEEEGFCSDSCLDPHDILGAVFHLLKCFADCNDQHTPNVLQLTLDELAGEQLKTLRFVARHVQKVSIAVARTSLWKVHMKCLEALSTADSPARVCKSL